MESKKVCSSGKPMQVIPHGVNTSDYFVVDKTEVESFRKQYFGKVADKFIFTSVARNQQRKDIPRTIAAFAEFRKQVKDSVLYLHCSSKDQGWDLPEVIKSYGLNTTEDVILPQNFGPNQGYPRQIVNLIYNASDCVVSTSLGEGFGLSWIESMATKTSIIVPDNTMMSEFVNEDNGYLVESGTSPSLFTTLPNDNEVQRPLVKVEDMVEKMLDVYNNPEEAKRRAENAYNWVTMKMDWQNNIVPQWVELFDKVYEEMQNNVGTVVEGDKIISTEKF
jgi:glycosyltransferase involved in cell wall biosynthesis